MSSSFFRSEAALFLVLAVGQTALFAGCATTQNQIVSPGKFLDHDTTAARGGVSNYGDSFSVTQPVVADAPAYVPSNGSQPAADKALAGMELETLSKDLFFNSGSAGLNRHQRKDLGRVAEMMKAHPEWKLTLIGHADPRGKATSNKRLSLERANSVKKALIDSGVPVGRMDIRAMGEVAEASKTDSGRLALDRNVEIRLKSE